MQFTLYSSTDASAPTLSGTAGDLVNLLDKCLVAGYGSKSAAGWTKPYTGTNGAVFRPASGSRFYLNVNDNAPGAGTAKEARVLGYEVMTAFATGTGLFPTAAQAANGLFVRKSTTADATTRGWYVIADGRTFYMFVDTGDSAGLYYAWTFGDFYSLVPGDLFNCQLNARGTENSSTNTVDALDVLNNGNAWVGTASTTTYIARPYTQQGTAYIPSHNGDGSIDTTGQGRLNAAGYSFPNIDNTILMSRMYLHNPTTAPVDHRHGWRRGLWQLGHIHTAIPIGFTFDGTGDLSGRSFRVLCKGVNNALYCYETSDTIDSN
jgi:hypothetical protein